MIVPVERKPSIRIAGYLEKRGKMRLLVCRWRRWWFVLEGRLLLYYKSQLEYLNLSPCRGSVNLGLASSVRPGKGLELSVVTRSQTVVLRASNRVDHEQWLQSLVDAAALPHPHPLSGRPGVLHFRYSSQDHHENIIERVKNFRCPSYAVMSDETTTSTPAQSGSYETSTSSSRSSNIGRSSGCMLRRVFSDSRTLLRRPYKRRNSARNSARLSKIAFSDTSIPMCTQDETSTPSDKCQSMQELRNSVAMSEENIAENTESSKELVKPVLNGSRESRLSNSIKIELNLEDIDSKSEENMKEQKIGNVKITLDGCAIYGKTEPTNIVRAVENDCKATKRVQDQSGYVDKRTLNLHLYNNKEVKSDTDLTVKRKPRAQSASCENMQTLDRSIGSTYNYASERVEAVGREERVSNLIASEPHNRKSNKKRSNSILSRFRENKPETENGSLERRPTIKKRLSFLRKVWKKRERKTEEEDYESVDYDSIPDVIELPSPESEKAEQLLLSLERQQETCPEPEPPPDYDISITEELEIPPMLPPRQKHRPVSPWHDVPKNNQPVTPVHHDTPPPLPEKKRKRKTHQVLIKITDDSSCIEHTLPSLGADSVKCEPPSRDGEHKLEDLDVLLAQLSQVNTYVVRQIDVSETEEGNVLQVSAAVEPVYDVPRPHISLLATLRAQTVRSDTFTPTHFLCTTPLIDSDSLDPVNTRLDAEMTPDSLECDSPWSMSHPTNSSDSSHSGSLMRSFITSEDKPFHDSLNS